MSPKKIDAIVIPIAINIATSNEGTMSMSPIIIKPITQSILKCMNEYHKNDRNDFHQIYAILPRCIDFFFYKKLQEESLFSTTSILKGSFFKIREMIIKKLISIGVCFKAVNRSVPKSLFSENGGISKISFNNGK